MHPIIANWGSITIHTYGLLLAAAFIAGIWLTSYFARKNGLNPDSIWSLGLVVIFASLVGAKLLLFLSDFSYYSENPAEIFSLSTLRSAGVYYGGLLLALAAAAWYLHRARMPGWVVADLAAPGIALGQAIGRIGCLSAGCCYGKPTDLPWGIRFTDKYAFENTGVPLNIPLHPTQLYESLGALLIFAYLTWRLYHKRFSGQVILEFLALYSILRFVIEFYRYDDRGFVLYELLSTSQFIGILTLLGSVLVYYLLHKRTGAKVKA
jgi:phosphatidylglycerol:prolipoprotein diacylglycerol transferase